MAQYKSRGTNPLAKLSAVSAISDARVTFTDPWTLWDDELLNQWTNSPTGSGARNRSVPSVIELTTGATGSSVCQQIYGSSLGGGFPAIVPGTTNAKFFSEYRARLMTAVDNQCNFGLGDGGVGHWGVLGAVSGFFAAFFDNGTTRLTSTIAIDNGVWHTFRVWRTGGVTFWQVDSETPVQSAAAFLSADMRLFLRGENNGTAAARTMQFDYVFLRGERP